MGFLLERPDGDVREVAVRFAWYAAVSVLVLKERGGVDRFHRVAPQWKLLYASLAMLA